jgi:monothiol glutaredoxin
MPSNQYGAEPSRAPAPSSPDWIRKEQIMSDNAVFDRIRDEITGTDVVLYMKGSPMFPQCGFSAAVVQVLGHLGVTFKGVNVLEDEEIRQGIKDFANWPTIPQLYVKGEFVGGCDIVREMAESGELAALLRDKGVPTTAPA